MKKCNADKDKKCAILVSKGLFNFTEHKKRRNIFLLACFIQLPKLLHKRNHLNIAMHIFNSLTLYL